MISHPFGRRFAAGAAALLAALAAATAQRKVDYQKDVSFAIDAIGKQCKQLLKVKGINWKKATRDLKKASKKTKNHEQHLRMLWRLLARLRDGHAAVKPLPAGKDVRVEWPDRSHAPGMFLCTVDDAVYVKNVFGAAEAAGVEPGSEVVTIDGKKAAEWLALRGEQLADLVSFSTPQQQQFYTCHWGLADERGTRLKLELRTGKKKQKRTISFQKGRQTAHGPAYPPADQQRVGDVFYARTEAGFGYLHIRRCKGELPEQVDQALAALGDVPGVILDFRGNSGGGFDHRALFGRFLPDGVEWRVGSGYRSAGPNPFGGPMVVIVDATVRSAGETAAGQFLEDGRAYGIGESATAGMSSSKTTIDLPSKLFSLYVSVASNKQRFAAGKGIEGLGVEPHERVAFKPADLAERRDTLIARAEELLGKFASEGFPKAVRYDPAKHGFAVNGR